MKTKTIISLIVVLLLLCSIAIFTGCTQNTASSSKGTSSNTTANQTTKTQNTATSNTSTQLQENSQIITEAPADSPYSTGIHHVTMKIQGYDEITIELNADEAPVSTWNFCTLAEKGYYDGLSFYRLAEGFCLQGGTAGNSISGSTDSLSAIIGEFSQNGINNQLANNFKKGTVAMARTNDPNSATSTFFITLDSSMTVSNSLNGLYAAFGTIDDAGMQIIDQVVNDYKQYVPASDAMGVIQDETHQPIIEYIKIVD